MTLFRDILLTPSEKEPTGEDFRTLDISLNQDGDLSTDDTLATFFNVSVFTDRLALTNDVLPDGSDDRRGWWGDTFNDELIGSRLWLIYRETTTQDTINRIRDYLKESLKWAIDDGEVSFINVSVERVGLYGINACIEADDLQLNMRII